MAEDNLFARVKNAIRAQNSNFCSISTLVTPLEEITPATLIQYTNCDGKTTEIPYGQILDNGGYIPDCVQGGSPISVENNIKVFIQYGTTDCNTPPPSSNLILLSCNKQTPYVISRGSITSTLTKGDICYITFKDNVVENGCYEIGEDTVDASVDTIQGEPQSFGPGKCLDCDGALYVTITSCSKGESFIVDPSGFTLTKDGVYNLVFSISVNNGCYTIGNKTSESPIDSIKNEPQLTPSCGQCP